MRIVAILAKVALVLAYPFLVYVGIRDGYVRAVGVATAAFAVVLLLASSKREKVGDARALAAGPVAIAILGAASAISADARFVLAMPTLASTALLLQFGSSLAGTPVVERFARMIDGELSDAQVRYCRTVTQVWCGYFVLNGGVAAFLALTGRTDLWTLHTGVLGYAGMGLLGGIEYLVRKARFRKFDDHPLDRALARILVGTDRP